MPKLMRWIESVKPFDDPDLTSWTLAAQGFRFSWKARFYPEALDRTVVKLAVSYELPGVLAPLMEPSILGGIVTKELQANLDRCRDLVQESY